MAVTSMTIGNWAIQFPGNMNPDSIDQYSQAISGKYNDWHQPIMSIIMSGVMACGCDLGLVTLIEASVGTAGLYVLATVLARRMGAPPGLRPVCGLSVCCIMYSPVSLLPFYLVSFVKDAWLAILFLWTAAVLLAAPDTPSRRRVACRAAAVCGLAICIVLVRHNSVVVLPLYAVAVAVIVHQQFSWFAASVAVAATLILPFAVERTLLTTFRVERKHPEVQLLALDLVGAVVYNPSLAAELPDTVSHLLPGYTERYSAGNTGSLYGWHQEPIVSSDYSTARNRENLWREYVKLLKYAPLTLVAVKADGFLALSYTRAGTYHDQLTSGIVENDLGLAKNHALRYPRNWQGRAHGAVLKTVPGLWMSAAQLPSLVVECLVLFWTVWRWNWRRDSNRFIDLMVAAIVTVYGVSYLATTTYYDHRFLYPSQLILQVVGAAVVVNYIVARVAGHNWPGRNKTV